LGHRESRFDAAFRENPSAIAGLDQKELDTEFANPITNSGDLASFFQKPRRL
jgi:hypothetical protein